MNAARGLNTPTPRVSIDALFKSAPDSSGTSGAGIVTDRNLTKLLATWPISDGFKKRLGPQLMPLVKFATTGLYSARLFTFGTSTAVSSLESVIAVTKRVEEDDDSVAIALVNVHTIGSLKPLFATVRVRSCHRCPKCAWFGKCCCHWNDRQLPRSMTPAEAMSVHNAMQFNQYQWINSKMGRLFVRFAERKERVAIASPRYIDLIPQRFRDRIHRERSLSSRSVSREDGRFRTILRRLRDSGERGRQLFDNIRRNFDQRSSKERIEQLLERIRARGGEMSARGKRLFAEIQRRLRNKKRSESSAVNENSESSATLNADFESSAVPSERQRSSFPNITDAIKQWRDSEKTVEDMLRIERIGGFASEVLGNISALSKRTSVMSMTVACSKVDDVIRSIVELRDDTSKADCSNPNPVSIENLSLSTDDNNVTKIVYVWIMTAPIGSAKATLVIKQFDGSITSHESQPEDATGGLVTTDLGNQRSAKWTGAAVASDGDDLFRGLIEVFRFITSAPRSRRLRTKRSPRPLETFNIVSLVPLSSYSRRSAAADSGAGDAIAAAADPTGITKLTTIVDSICKTWTNVVSAFKTKVTETVERIERLGFDFFHQRSELVYVTGVKREEMPQFTDSIVQTFGLPTDKRIKTVLRAIAWGDDAVWAQDEFLYNSANTNNVANSLIILKHSHVDGTKVDIVIIHADTKFTLAPDLLVVTKSKSYLGGIYESSKTEIRKVPHTVTLNDTIVLQEFMRIVSYAKLADQLGVPYKLPNLNAARSSRSHRSLRSAFDNIAIQERKRRRTLDEVVAVASRRAAIPYPVDDEPVTTADRSQQLAGDTVVDTFYEFNFWSITTIVFALLLLMITILVIVARRKKNAIQKEL